MPNRTLLALSCASLLACAGRKPENEFRLSSPAIENADFANALFQATGAQLRPGHHIDIVDNGKVFDAAVEEIGHAQKSIHIVSFIWSKGAVSDRLIDAIASRTAAGVACRVIVDAVGSMSFGDVEKRLQQAGCESHRIRPVPGQDDLARDHRKMIIVDGKVGITGGFGIDDKWDGDGMSDDPPEWRDSNVRVRGPAVLEMQQTFSQDWQEVTGSLLPASEFPAPDQAGQTPATFVSSTENAVATRNDRLTQLLIGSAKKRIWIMNPYFVPSTPIMELLVRKAHEGLDVRVLAAGDKTDTKPYLPPQRDRMATLAREGVRTDEYDPAMLHGKMMLVDDAIVMVGSCNLDPLSLNKMEEGAIVALDPALSRDESQRFLDDLELSKERVVSRRTAGR